MLNAVEQDFLAFLAERNQESLSEVQGRYEASKKAIDFSGKAFSAYEKMGYDTLQVFFNDANEKSLFASYQYYAYPDLLRMLSYSFPKPKTSRGYVTTLLKALRTGDFAKIRSYAKRRSSGGPTQSLANRLLEGRDTVTILDYGCGLGYLSLELAQKAKKAKIILVDLDTIKLDFAEYRFRKHGIAFETIRITAENQYPDLPAHDICIATDVMEHLYQPLLAYAHIRDSQRAGGLLYGNFGDHHEEMFHVHPHMSDLRHAVAESYADAGSDIYKKR